MIGEYYLCEVMRCCHEFKNLALACRTLHCADINPYLKLLSMLAGIGSPGTLQEVRGCSDVYGPSIGMKYTVDYSSRQLLILCKHWVKQQVDAVVKNSAAEVLCACVG
jgi:hypothetical protein